MSFFSDRLTPKQIAVELRALATKAPAYTSMFDERDKFTVVIDGTKLTCINTDLHIQSMALKFEKSRPLTTPKRAQNARREAPRVIYKRYQHDVDAPQFAALFKGKIV